MNQEELKNIIQIIYNSLTSPQEEFKNHLANIQEKLSSLSKDEINSYIPSKFKKNSYSNLTEIILTHYLKYLNDIPTSNDSVDRLIKILTYIFSLSSFDINAKNPGKNQGIENYSLLHLAVSNIVTNEDPYDKTLHLRHLQSLLQLFYKHGADFNIKTEMHETPMHIVIYRHRNAYTAKELISILHKLGSGLNLINKHCKTPYDLVSEKSPGSVTYNSELSDMILELGGLPGSVVSESFKAIKLILEYSSSSISPPKKEKYYLNAHDAILSNNISKLEKLCLEGAQLTLKDKFGKSAIDLILESENCLSFLSSNYIKTAIQSQCEYGEIRKVHEKLLTLTAKEDEEIPTDSILDNIIKHPFFTPHKSKEAKSISVEKWEKNMVSLCKCNMIRPSIFNIYMKSKFANQNSFLNILKNCGEDEEGMLIRKNLQEYCAAYIKNNPNKISLIPPEIELNIHKKALTP